MYPPIPKLPQPQLRKASLLLLALLIVLTPLSPTFAAGVSSPHRPNTILARSLASHYPDLSYEQWDTSIARKHLQALDTITGSAVGSDGLPGRFYLLAVGFLAFPDKALYMQMLDSKAPSTERAMGVLGLTLMFPGYDLTIRDHYSDPELIDYLPLGCIVQTKPLGQIIHEIHTNPSCLGF